MNKIINRIKFNWNYVKRIKFSPKGIYIFCLVLKDSFKWCFSINIGNYLKQDGKKYYVNNGVKLNYWDCLEVNNKLEIIRPDGNLAISTLIPKEGSRKIYKLSTPLSDFMQGFRFYMGYWYEIWVFGDWSYNDRPSKIK
jgi:hypothetical protein